MKSASHVLIGMLLTCASQTLVHAQASYGTQAYASQQQEEERWRRLSAQMDDMEATQEVLRNRITALETENRSLRADLSRAGSAGVTPGEFQRVIGELTAKIKEVDDKRIADNQALLKQVTDLIRGLKIPTTTPAATPPSTGGTGSSLSGEEYTHVIQSGQSIWTVVEEFKRQGVNTSVQAVLDANPNVDPNRIQVGQKIIIPRLK